MVGLLANDDELAGLLGHELGHILMHQNAVIVSQLFHQILGVNTVSDRKDISEKLRRMFDTIDGDSKLLGKAARIIEGRKESVRMRQMVWRCMPRRRLDFRRKHLWRLLRRLKGINGSNGNVLTDFFGETNSNLRRLREIKRL